MEAIGQVQWQRVTVYREACMLTELPKSHQSLVQDVAIIKSLILRVATTVEDSTDKIMDLKTFLVILFVYKFVLPKI